MESNLNVKDDMHIGKLIRLSDAAKRLSELDNDDVNIFWTMRYCHEEYVKFAIKLPFKINAWEWNGDLVKRRYPAMGKGDIINTRHGVFFIGPEDIEAVIENSTEEFETSFLHVINNDSERGYMRIEVASNHEAEQFDIQRNLISDEEYDVYLNEIDKEEFEESLEQNQIDRLKDNRRYEIKLDKDFNDAITKTRNQTLETLDKENNYISIKLDDLYVWQEDFNNALENNGYDERKTNSIESIKKDLHGDRKSQCKWMLEYLEEMGIDRTVELTDQQMKEFRFAAISKGMTENSFKDRRKELEIFGIDRSK